MKINYDNSLCHCEFDDTIERDTANIYFTYWFHSDKVIIYSNGMNMFKENLSTNQLNDVAGSFEFKKSKIDSMRIIVNGKSSNIFLFDRKYNNVIIELRSNFVDSLIFTYSKEKPLFD